MSDERKNFARMSDESKSVISFSGADILNGENPVVYGLDMEVLPGQVVYIVGKVGTGKTLYPKTDVRSASWSTIDCASSQMRLAWLATVAAQ